MIQEFPHAPMSSQEKGLDKSKAPGVLTLVDLAMSTYTIVQIKISKQFQFLHQMKLKSFMELASMNNRIEFEIECPQKPDTLQLYEIVIHTTITYTLYRKTSINPPTLSPFIQLYTILRCSQGILIWILFEMPGCKNVCSARQNQQFVSFYVHFCLDYPISGNIV